MFGCFHFNCRGNKNALEDILEKSCESENEISEEENLGRGMRSNSCEMKNSSKKIPIFPLLNVAIFNSLDT